MIAKYRSSEGLTKWVEADNLTCYGEIVEVLAGSDGTWVTTDKALTVQVVRTEAVIGWWVYGGEVFDVSGMSRQVRQIGFVSTVEAEIY